MTVRELFESVRRQGNLLRAKQAELTQTELDIMSLKSPLMGDRIQSNHKASVDELVERLEVCREKIGAELLVLTAMKEQASRIMKREQDLSKRAVLIYRYMNGRKWEDIAEEMHYSRSQILQMHAHSLRYLESLWKDRTKSD